MRRRKTYKCPRELKLYQKRSPESKRDQEIQNDTTPPSVMPESQHH